MLRRQSESNYLSLLTNILEVRNKYQGIYIYLYEYVNGKIGTSCNTFSSINELSKYLGVARETLSVYLNTYVPYRNSLILTNEIESFELVEKLVSDATQGLVLDKNIAKKVWMYSIESDSSIVKTIYESKGAVAKLLNIQHKTITNHLDKFIKGGISDNYIFSRELDSLGLNRLMEISSLRKFNNCRVWAYNASTLELLLDSFSSMQKAADYFNVDYRSPARSAGIPPLGGSILNHLDTKLATMKGGRFVLLFSHELTQWEKESLLKNVQKAVNETVSVWVYKSVNDKLILLALRGSSSRRRPELNNNKPTYSSKLEACKELKMSTKTISKYLDSDKEYKGLYFYSVEASFGAIKKEKILSKVWETLLGPSKSEPFA